MFGFIAHQSIVHVKTNGLDFFHIEDAVDIDAHETSESGNATVRQELDLSYQKAFNSVN
jgi:hypothetical protein